jgi:hypothetical protein
MIFHAASYKARTIVFFEAQDKAEAYLLCKAYKLNKLSLSTCEPCKITYHRETFHIDGNPNSHMEMFERLHYTVRCDGFDRKLYQKYNGDIAKYLSDERAKQEKGRNRKPVDYRDTLAALMSSAYKK